MIQIYNQIYDFFYTFRLIYIIFSPLFIFFTIFFYGRKIGVWGCWYIIIFNTFFQLFCFFYFFFEFSQSFGNNIVCLQLGNWFKIGYIRANFNFIFDSLSVLMMQLVIFISVITQIYSFFYLYNEPNLIRFQSYISLFTFFMLVLVTADNFVLFFLGWEGVGLCSYLLISFWSTRVEARIAGLKAVAVNRIGDCAFIAYVAMIAVLAKSVEFPVIFNVIGYYSNVTVHIFNWEIKYIAIANFFALVAVMAKSAQIGLHIWLADAMEGPTPVSALIHAATMVTAGIYLVIRVSFIFDITPNIKEIMAYIGALTALFGASVAAFQWDIKKIIAYSTCSQLGYMLCVCGFGGYKLGFYHLITHGYFKALLFFSAGLVIHNLNGEQDMRKMGGLINCFPLAAVYFFVGLSSLVGLPGTAGYFSKERILDYISVIPTDNAVSCYTLLILALVFTSIYSMRLINYIFFGDFRGFKVHYTQAQNIVTEAPNYVIFVLTFLAILSIVADTIFHNFTVGLNSSFLNTSFSGQINNNFFFFIADTHAFYNRHIPMFAIFIGVVFYYIFEYFFYCFSFFSYLFQDLVFFCVEPVGGISYYFKWAVRNFINWFSFFFRNFYIFFQKAWLIDYSIGYFFFPIFKFFVNSSFIVEKGFCEYFGPYGIKILFNFITYRIDIFNISRSVMVGVSIMPIVNILIILSCF